MSGIITHERRTYIVLPRDHALLYAEFNNNAEFGLRLDLEFSIKNIASKGVKSPRFLRTKYNGNDGAKALFKVSPRFYRGAINPDIVQPRSKGLEKYLGEDKRIDTSAESVQSVAQEIINQLPCAHRRNTYATINGIVHWIKENIEFTLVASYIIDDVRRTIEFLPEEQRYDPFTVLRYSFNIKDDYLRRAANMVYLPKNIKDSRQLAKELMTQAGNAWGLFQLFWLEENSTSASTTIENKEGKCVGISNTYTALARALEIPSREISGYATSRIFGGNHSWATSYVHPYGWVEVDPTFGEFKNFDYDTHAYDFSFDHENLPRFSMLEKGSDDPAVLEDVIEFLERDKSWLDILVRRNKHKSDIEFLKSLRSK